MALDALMQPVELPLAVVLALLAYTPERLARALGTLRGLRGGSNGTATVDREEDGS